jgi:hypothetical protein
MFNLIPLQYRIAASVVALLAALFAIYSFGYGRGAASVQAKWDAEKLVTAQAVTKQAAHVVAAVEAQAAVTQESDNETQGRIAAVHRMYANRVRQPAASHPGAVSAAAEPSGDPATEPADAGPVAGGLRPESWSQLAERCAVTTVIAQGWQEWWSNVEKVQVMP